MRHLNEVIVRWLLKERLWTLKLHRRSHGNTKGIQHGGCKSVIWCGVRYVDCAVVPGYRVDPKNVAWTTTWFGIGFLGQ
jgi:hypothetical protein